MTSAVLIIPAALRAAANALGAAMGWGSDNYTVPLSASGEAPATLWLCRTDVTMVFLATVLAAGYDLASAGLETDQIAGVQAALDAMEAPPAIPPGAAAVIAALDMDLSEALWGEEHTKAALASRGLSRVREDF